MVSCPNSTEGGCRCPDHHPGLLAFASDRPALEATLDVVEPVRLRLVTPGPSVAQSPQQVRAESKLAALRRSCTACGGAGSRCNEGMGSPAFRRLPGCAAFTEGGELATAAAARQPWEPRPARRRAVA